MPSQGVLALSRGHIPDFAGAIYGARDAQLTRPVELARGDLAAMTSQRVNATARHHLLRRVKQIASQYIVATEAARTWCQASGGCFRLQ